MMVAGLYMGALICAGGALVTAAQLWDRTALRHRGDRP